MSASPLDAQVDGYLLHLKVERDLARNTLQAYARDLARFVEHALAKGRTDARDITADDLADWARGLSGSGLKASSQARMLVTVRGFYRHLRREEEVERLPTEQVDLPKVGRRLPRHVDGDEVIRLLAAAGSDLRDRAVVALLYGGGLRVSEVVDLDLAQLHLDAGVVQVVGKGRKERLVPIGGLVVDVLRAYLEHDRPKRLRGRTLDALFPGRGARGRVSRQAIFIRLRRLAVEAGLEQVISPHALRHGFATDLVRGGADLRSVQAMLGHADLRTTEIYTKVDDGHLRHVYAAAHPRR